MIVTAQTLDQFISDSDALGGPGHPGCEQAWLNFRYEPTYRVNENLDPFSEAYVEEQLRLYQEITGHSYSVLSDEKTVLDVGIHVQAANPYNHPDPSMLAMHLQRLSRAFRYAKARKEETLLDLGCGWGLSSELAAYLGLNVQAIDVNADFVRLVNERAVAGNRTIVAQHSTFEDFTLSAPADLALFYECFHHAVRPWVVLDHVVNNLTVGGRLMLAGEPINTIWWQNWGLRLDALSVYCIRKFGWFESGWSMPFLERLLCRSGLIPRVHHDTDPEIGPVVIGTKFDPDQPVAGDAAVGLFDPLDSARMLPDNGYLILTGAGSATLRMPTGKRAARLDLVNFRAKPIRAKIKSRGATIFDGHVSPGSHQVIVPVSPDALGAPIEFDIERWVPAKEIGNGDTRTLGLHIREISFL